MDGENEEALHTIENIRSLEEKPDARLMTDLIDEALIQARQDSSSTSGPSYEQAFALGSCCSSVAAFCTPFR